MVVCAAGVLVAVTAGALAVAGALVARQRAESAADLAALAAARGGAGCAVAARVAAAAGGRVVACAVDGSAVAPDVSLVVEVPVPGVLAALDVPPARARARAGVPP